MAVRKKKFDIQSALMSTVAAAAGGASASLVAEKIGEFMPENPSVGAFAPIAIGAYLSGSKNTMLRDAGLGMIGASSGVLLDAIGVNGVGRTKGARAASRLTPAQEKRLLQMVRQNSPMKAAGAASFEQNLAGALG